MVVCNHSVMLSETQGADGKIFLDGRFIKPASGANNSSPRYARAMGFECPSKPKN